MEPLTKNKFFCLAEEGVVARRSLCRAKKDLALRSCAQRVPSRIAPIHNSCPSWPLTQTHNRLSQSNCIDFPKKAANRNEFVELSRMKSVFFWRRKISLVSKLGILCCARGGEDGSILIRFSVYLLAEELAISRTKLAQGVFSGFSMSSFLRICAFCVWLGDAMKDCPFFKKWGRNYTCPTATYRHFFVNFNFW